MGMVWEWYGNGMGSAKTIKGSHVLGSPGEFFSLDKNRATRKKRDINTCRLLGGSSQDL